MRKVIAIDFDGTLCQNKYPEIGEPIIDVINKAKEEQKNGTDLVLWTCREGKLLDDAIEWCKNQGLTFEAINDSTAEWKSQFNNNPRKIGATEYWDDKSYNPCPPIVPPANYPRSMFLNHTRKLLKCRNCSHEVQDTNFCPHCGVRLK